MLDGVLGQQAGVVGGAAGHDEDLVDGLEVRLGDVRLVEEDAPVVEVATEGVADGGGLLVDLLDHEGVVAALLRGGEVPVDGERAAGCGAVEAQIL